MLARYQQHSQECRLWQQTTDNFRAHTTAADTTEAAGKGDRYRLACSNSRCVYRTMQLANLRKQGREHEAVTFDERKHPVGGLNEHHACSRFIEWMICYTMENPVFETCRTKLDMAKAL